MRQRAIPSAAIPFAALPFAAALLAFGLTGAAAQQPAPTPTAPAAAAPAAQPSVDLKLMEKSEANRSRGCTVALWQPNRDPDNDRYAFQFIEQLTGQNNARQPARIKIGEQIVPLRRVAVGGKTSGYGLFEYQLYKMPGEDEFVVLELKLGPIEGEAVDIEGGTISIMMRGRQVFRASVKGGAGCMTAPISAAAAGAPAAAAAAPASAPATAPAAAPAPAAPRVQTAALSRTPPPRMFQKYAVRPQQISRAFLEAVRKAHGCDPQFVRRVGITGYQMSEESAIWEIPCEAFAYQGASVLALVYLTEPSENLSFAELTYPRGIKRETDAGKLMNSTWDVARRTVTGVALGRAQGDCGTLERHRVREDGTFELTEIRSKPNCDGRVVKPEEFPLVFQAR
ncbi:MAG: DUF1176 domain-containing protein [Hyphomonas sp.]|nr:DUF1176 domain-containing protein [Hyphomonas sp.]